MKRREFLQKSGWVALRIVNPVGINGNFLSWTSNILDQLKSYESMIISTLSLWQSNWWKKSYTNTPELNIVGVIVQKMHALISTGKPLELYDSIGQVDRATGVKIFCQILSHLDINQQRSAFEHLFPHTDMYTEELHEVPSLSHASMELNIDDDLPWHDRQIAEWLLAESEENLQNFLKITPAYKENHDYRWTHMRAMFECLLNGIYEDSRFPNKARLQNAKRIIQLFNGISIGWKKLFIEVMMEDMPWHMMEECLEKYPELQLLSGSQNLIYICRGLSARESSLIESLWWIQRIYSNKDILAKYKLWESEISWSIAWTLKKLFPEKEIEENTIKMGWDSEISKNSVEST
jgi:hypothetical protein